MSRNTYNPTQYYSNVPNALDPLSANTEYNMCLYCSGTTVSIPVPHPTYTNEYGKAVVQLNAVVIGGENGLNS